MRRRKNDRIDKKRIKKMRSVIDNSEPLRPWNVQHNPKRHMLAKQRSKAILKANRKMVMGMMQYDGLVAPRTDNEEEMRQHVFRTRRLARQQRQHEVQRRNRELMERLLKVETNFSRKEWQKDARMHAKIGAHMSRYRAAAAAAAPPKRLPALPQAGALPPLLALDAPAAAISSMMGAARAGPPPALPPMQGVAAPPPLAAGAAAAVPWQAHAASVQRRHT
eukprot:g6595.t1